MELKDIITQVNILEYISQYSDFEQRTDGEYWGLSPLQEEQTPSFSINTEKQKFYDFSSGCGGNILDFIQKYEKCNFYKAVTILKKYLNLSDSDIPQQSFRLESTKIAKKFKSHNKQDRKEAGVKLSSNYMDRYTFDESKLQLWRDEGISFETMKYFGVTYDPVSNRIVYPIKNMCGEIINVCGRTLDVNFKANRLRKYTYFCPLGTLNTIYGFSENKDEIMTKKEIILFEGAKSVMIAREWGVKNTGALLTSHLNPNQFSLLIQMGVKIVFALDAEVDIRKDKYISKLPRYTTVEWIRNQNDLLEIKDSPVDKGFEVFKTLYENRVKYKK